LGLHQVIVYRRTQTGDQDPHEYPITARLLKKVNVGLTPKWEKLKDPPGKKRIWQQPQVG